MIVTLAKRWSVGGWLIAAILLLPLAALIIQAIPPDPEHFDHLANTVLNSYIITTILLVLLVSIGCLLLGVPVAWLIAMCRFPGHRHFQWAMLLPLAMPGYLIAYVYTDLLDYAGPIQSWLRDWMGWQRPSDYQFPQVRSLGGAAVMLSLVLFPYVYMMARTAFMEQSGALIQASRTMGLSPLRSFFRLSLPLARPAITVGVALAAMETLADFATVSYFAVNTLTTAVYDTWLSYGSLASAAKFSCMMLAAALALILGERFARRQKQRFQNNHGAAGTGVYLLTGMKKWLAFGFCALLLGLSFVLPAAILLDYAFEYFDADSLGALWHHGGNSFLVAGLTAVTTAILALLLQFMSRMSPRALDRWPARISGFGYAMPGTVLAIGILAPMVWLDNGINYVAEWLSLPLPGLLLSGSLLALIFGYCVRFIAVPLGSVEASYQRLSPNLDKATLSMGHGPSVILKKVHLPLLRRGLLAASLIVFLEAMKELPAALLLKPIGFETLSTYVYQYVSDEALELGALPALLIVALGLIPVVMLNRNLENQP